MDTDFPGSSAEQQRPAKRSVVLAWCAPGQVIAALGAGHLGTAYPLIVYGNEEVFDGLVGLLPTKVESRQFPPGGPIALLKGLRRQIADLKEGRLIALYGSSGFSLKVSSFLWLLGLPGCERWTCDVFLRCERLTVPRFILQLAGCVLKTLAGSALMMLFYLRFRLALGLRTPGR